MRRTWLSVLCTTLLALLATPALAALKVVATVPDLAALARAVGGERVEVTALALPTQDPHFVDAKPSLALELNRADLLLAIGLGLESGWLPTLQTGARNPRILAGSPGYWEASSAVRLLEVPEAPVDRSAGDIHPGGNPHFLYDPRAALVVAKALAARLAQVDPAGASAYQANLARFTTELEAARAQWEQQLAPLRRPARHRLPQVHRVPGGLAGDAAHRVHRAQARHPAQPLARGPGARAVPPAAREAGAHRGVLPGHVRPPARREGARAPRRPVRGGGRALRGDVHPEHGAACAAAGAGRPCRPGGVNDSLA
jgi:hypothetical protein